MKHVEQSHQLLVLVPQSWLNEVAEDLKFLRKHFKGDESKKALADWISEKEGIKRYF